MLMPGNGWRRAATAAFVLVGLVIALFLRPGQGTLTVHTPGAPPVVTAVGQGQPPGCGEDSSSEAGGLRPAAPPRSATSCELLPALYDARVASGAWAPDGTIVDVRPERAPPPLAAPSPVDLSILRV
ncbi:hypothetical protein [Streptomyces sp. SP18CS02]|uniref:hypothetical protein n=1 Tax=Streptomyces sp. SP18CS02 TaxID=3002531 RepID=UPI002E777C0B|nr:hypothetical protein [Streptomyces sp. SP18CS02]MEE1754148.1 hypothetical protein [Streptomyces sp. SP18CS02]